MTITKKRYTKDGFSTTLEFGFGSSDGYTMYYVLVDGDLVVIQTKTQSAAYAAWRGANQACIDCGWTEDTAPAFTGR